MPKRTILVLDDERNFLSLLSEHLTSLGYEVFAAADGISATNLIAAESIDLVITDLLMPDKDGIELIAELRRTHPQLPVVAMSGGGRMPAMSYLKLARSLGAKALLEKPFSREQLLFTIEMALPPKVGADDANP